MQLVDVTVQVPKEAKEVADLLVVLAMDIKAKKSVAEIAGDALPKALAAAEGISALGEEIKAPEMAALAGLLAGQLIALFMPAPAAPAPAPAAPAHA